MNDLDYYVIKILEDKLKYLHSYKIELENNNLFFRKSKEKLALVTKEIRKYDNLLMNEYIRLEQTKK